MGDVICLNGEFINSDEPIFHASNRSFHYGDGCFETMKLVNNTIALWKYHEERFVQSLKALKMRWPQSLTPDEINNNVLQLAMHNNHSSVARIRLTFFRGDGNLYEFDQPFQYLIESFVLQPDNRLNEKGLTVGFFTGSVKHYDEFSFIKSTSYLPSVMANINAKENKLDDVILLNSQGFVTETSVANIFIVKDNVIKTPSMQQGCVSGTMRKYLIKCFTKDGLEINETVISKDDVYDADEVFITNAVKGMEWIERCDKTFYNNEYAKQLYKRYIQPL